MSNAKSTIASLVKENLDQVKGLSDRRTDSLTKASQFSTWGYKTESGQATSYWSDPTADFLPRWNKSFPFQLRVYENDALIATFTLPIPPSDFSVSNDIPITTMPTFGGVVNMHSAQKYMNISMSGTTGMYPFVSKAKAGGQLNAITLPFANTLAQAQLAASLTNNLTGQPYDNGMVESNKGGLLAGDAGSVAKVRPQGTGFFQFLLLRSFIENYISLSSQNSNVSPAKVYTLKLYNMKEWEEYSVIPIQFNFRKSSEAPNMYYYQLGFRAFARKTGVVDNFEGAEGERVHVVSINSVLGAGNITASTYVSLASAAVSDTTGIVVGTLGQTQKLATTFLDSINLLVESISTTADIFDPDNLFNETVGVSVSAYRNYLERTAGFFAEQPDQETLPNQVSNKRDWTGLLDKVSGNAPVVIDINGQVLPLPIVPPEDPNVVFLNNNIGTAVNMAKAKQIAEAQTQSNSGATDPMVFVSGLAAKSGLAFSVPTSKIRVPWKNGYTMERFALEQLGDANRAPEIVTLNGLKAPYIDEIGFTRYLNINADQNHIVVSSDHNLMVGQQIELFSDTQNNRVFTIMGISKVDDSYFVLALDRDASEYLKSANAALHTYLPYTVNSLQYVFVPSNEPDDLPQFSNGQVVGVDYQAKFLKVAGFDLPIETGFGPYTRQRLDGSTEIVPTNVSTPVYPDGSQKFIGDLMINQDGSMGYSQDLGNIIQSIWIALNTPQGSLLQHPGYGFGVSIGTTLADITAQDVASAVQVALSGDPSISSVENLSVSVQNTKVVVSFVARIAGVNERVPVSLSL
jgi:hypothetical protein